MALTLFINILLWGLVAALMLAAAVRSQALCREGAWEGARDFVVLIPRVLIGVVGSGYIAAVMPQQLVTTWIGPQSGLLGISIATLAGAITPGGAVVGFAIGAAALKGGAGAPQVIAFSTAWSLYALQRLINWEIHMMPRRVVWLRAAVSVPLPFLALPDAVGEPRLDRHRYMVTSLIRPRAQLLCVPCRGVDEPRLQRIEPLLIRHPITSDRLWLWWCCNLARFCRLRRCEPIGTRCDALDPAGVKLALDGAFGAPAGGARRHRGEDLRNALRTLGIDQVIEHGSPENTEVLDIEGQGALGRRLGRSWCGVGLQRDRCLALWGGSGIR